MTRQYKPKSDGKPHASQEAAHIDQLKKLLAQSAKQKRDKQSFNYFLRHFSKNTDFMKNAEELCNLYIVNKILLEIKNVLQELSGKQADEAEQAQPALMESAEIGMIHGCVYGKTFLVTLFYLAEEKTGVIGLVSTETEGMHALRFSMDISPEQKAKAEFGKQVALLKTRALNANDSKSARATMKYFDTHIVRKKNFIYYVKPLEKTDIVRGILTNLANIVGEELNDLFRRERNPQFLCGRLPESALTLMFLYTENFRANIFYVEDSRFGFIDVSLKTNEYRIAKFYVSESKELINVPCAPGIQ